MNTIDWLCQHAPGFQELPEPDRQAIMQFSLIWSFFEAKELNTKASASTIEALVQSWSTSGQLNIEPFSPPLAYFRNRYFQNGKQTSYFEGLELRDNKQLRMVTAVLSGENNDPVPCVTALFIVVYRLRNNLFHGTKWAYGIKDQLSNFTHASLTLMAALEVGGRFRDGT
jgi:hypothetical protein